MLHPVHPVQRGACGGSQVPCSRPWEGVSPARTVWAGEPVILLQSLHTRTEKLLFASWPRRFCNISACSGCSSAMGELNSYVHSLKVGKSAPRLAKGILSINDSDSSARKPTSKFMIPRCSQLKRESSQRTLPGKDLAMQSIRAPVLGSASGSWCLSGQENKWGKASPTRLDLPLCKQRCLT